MTFPHETFILALNIDIFFIAPATCVFPCRNLRHDVALHAARLPNQDLPQPVHLSYSKSASLTQQNKEV